MFSAAAQGRVARVSKNSLGVYSVYIRTSAGSFIARRSARSAARVQAIANEWSAKIADKNWQ